MKGGKTRLQLLQICSVAFGIEFCDSAQKALVTPMLLKLGIPMLYMPFIWGISPVIGLTIGPVCGALSDKCRSKFGRRKPFIFIFSVGIVTSLVLLLLPLGQIDHGLHDDPGKASTFVVNSTASDSLLSSAIAVTLIEHQHRFLVVFLTVTGATLGDVCTSICQSPVRAYLMEVTNSEDQQRGLGTLTLMAGLGGSTAFIIGGINWGISSFVKAYGGYENFVFTLAFLVYIVCAILTLTAAKEVPLLQTESEVNLVPRNESEKDKEFLENHSYYGSVQIDSEQNPTEKENTVPETYNDDLQANTTVKEYLISVIHMPRSLLLLCITHMFSWMSIHCYCLFFTDFVGEAIYKGDPTAPSGSDSQFLYNDGVRFGSLISSLYLISCAGYSVVITSLVKRFGAKRIYFFSQLVYAVGSAIAATIVQRVFAVVASITAGIMYATLFNIPFMLVAHYEEKRMSSEMNGKMSLEMNGKTKQSRGFGTDVSILVSIVFVAQLVVSLLMGPLVDITSTQTIMICASIFSACGAITATQVTYLDL